MKPGAFGRPNDFLITRASKFGDQKQHWNGVDVTLNTRPRAGVMLQGGLSTGRTTTDTCDIVDKVAILDPLASVGRFRLGNFNPSKLYCRTQENFLTQVKFLGAYTIPRVDVLVSGAFRSEAGPAIAANYVASNAVVRPSLGRNLAGGARNVTVNVVEPGTMYGERMNQLDLRFAKIFRVGASRTNVSLDIYNVFNGNPVLRQSNSYSNRRTPQSILLARFIKVGVQFDF